MMQKRLRTILHLLKTRDYRELESEINAIKSIANNEELSEIIQNLEADEYKIAMVLITNYLTQKEEILAGNQLKIKDENDVAGLRTSAKLCEIQISVLHFRKSIIVKQLGDFRLRHQDAVGTIMGEILRLRKEILWQKLIESKIDKSDFEDAKTDYEKYREHVKSVPKGPQKLSEHLKKELQRAFREASKLCHPDVIAEESKEVANQVFAELNDAYFKNEINRVKEILVKLKNDEIHLIGITEKVSEKQKLQIIVAKHQNEISQLKNQIAEMQTSEAFRTVNDIQDWDAYFDNLSERFAQELDVLKKEHKEVVGDAMNN